MISPLFSQFQDSSYFPGDRRVHLPCALRAILEFVFALRAAEHNFMSGLCEDRSELATH
jgi:hypothetical protein